MPAHVLFDYWLPSPEERDDLPLSRPNSPAPRRVLLTQPRDLATGRPQVTELVPSSTVPEPGTASPEISPANAALFDMPPDSAGTPPVITQPRLSEKLPPNVSAKFKALLEEFKQVFVRDFSAPHPGPLSFMRFDWNRELDLEDGHLSVYHKRIL
eukprot:gene42278-biopygen20661